MTGEIEREAAKRDRSPKFPYISLPKSLERIDVLYAKAKRYDVRIADIAKDWEMSAKSSSTDRTVAAIQSFGLIEDSGSGENRKIRLSELGARILADARAGVRESLLAEAATKPPIIAEYANKWANQGRPDDAHALSQLQFEGGFTEDAAKLFLRVYDETIRFVSSRETDNNDHTLADRNRDEGQARVEPAPNTPPSPGEFLPNTHPEVKPAKVFAEFVVASGEREWLRGPLSRGVSYRLIVSGDLGPREIGKLIKVLETQKMVLQEDETD